MYVWIDELNRMLDFLTRSPATPMQKWAIVGLSVLAMLTVFGTTAKGLMVPNSDPFRTTVVVIVGGLMTLLGAIAVQRYLPDIGPAVIHPWLPLGGAVLVCLLVVLPLATWWHRGKYFDLLIAWGASVAVAVAIVFLINAAVDAANTGGKSGSKATSRRRDLEEIIGK